ncbi:MAG TPA: transposase [Streptosporangiaceae bacterium]|nr:transposase [Streptosporangiaceae bacterium]
MRTAYRCRAYPDEAQQAILVRTFGCVRVVWNRTLAARHARYHAECKGTSYAETDRALTVMKQDPDLAFLSEVSSVPLQQALRHQQAVARGAPGDACGADVRHSGTSRVRSAVKQEPRPARAGIPVLWGGE